MAGFNSSAPLVSVITPSHNTKISLLKKGMDSLLSQTLGFDKIEWIITVHNSEESHYNETAALTKDYDNIKVLKLNSKERTPSVPRNFCLDHAVGKYVAFMDSDDAFTPNALKDVTTYLEENGAEMASFRAQLEAEDRSVVRFMDDRAPYEQLDDCYVLPKNDPRRGMLLYGGNSTVWSKVILRDFIEEHHIRFNVNVTIGEDGLFNLNCYKYANKVLILPQTIGYRYYMNHGSLAQNTVNSGHTSQSIRDLANNCTDILDAAIDANVSLYYEGWGVGALMASSLIVSTGITGSDREYVRSKMAPYIEKFPRLGDDGKIYTKETAAQIMNLVNSVILGRPGEKQDRFATQLAPILAANAGCELGKRYHFNEIKSIREYQDAFPLTDYAFYRPFVDIMTRVGDTGIIAKHKINTYSVVHGGIGELYYIPIVEDSVKLLRSNYLSIIEKAAGSTYSIFAAHPIEARENPDGSRSENLNSVWLRGLSDLDIFNSHKRTLKYGTITSPNLLVYSVEKADLTYAELLFALADRDVSLITAPFTENVLLAMECLRDNWKQLVQDLFIGAVSEASGLPVETREALSAQLAGNPDRAMEIAQICREGFENIAVRIWPGLKTIAASGTGRYAADTKQMKYYTGNVPLDNGFISTSAGVIAKSAGLDTDIYTLFNDISFMEFLPDKNPANRCAVVEELEEGRMYEVVITNHAGLYRYRTGVTLKVVRTSPDGVQVKFVISA